MAPPPPPSSLEFSNSAGALIPSIEVGRGGKGPVLTSFPPSHLSPTSLGTGLISEGILPHVHSVLGVDASQGMVDTFNKKIATKKLQNTTAQYVSLLFVSLPSSPPLYSPASCTLSHSLLFFLFPL